MEGDTFVLLFLALFFGVFAMKSLSIPKGTGIVVRTGGMFGIGSKASASFLWVVLIVVVLLIIINCSFDARSCAMEGSTSAVIMFLVLLFAILALNSMFAAPVPTHKPKHTPGATKGILSAPFLWVAVIVIGLVINGGR